MTMRTKILDRDTLSRVLPTMERPLVFTNGVFDILHPGHVTYLEDARRLGAALFVGLNSDESARLLEKGTDRPISRQEDRAIMLAALESVTWITVFEEQTPLSLLRIVKPDIYVKGGDYNVELLPESALVRSWGGTVRALSFLNGYSTTEFLARIRSGEA